MIRRLLTDEEWRFFEPFVVIGRPARRQVHPKPPARVLNTIFSIARAGAPWRHLPADLGNWNSVFRQFRRWTAFGLWDVDAGGLGRWRR